MSTLLPVMILLPLATAVVVLLARSAGAARWISLLGTLATLVLSLVLTAQFTQLRPLTASGAGPIQPRLEFRQTWMTFSWTDSPAASAASSESQAAGTDVGRQVRLEFYFGMDGISLLLAVLTTLLMVSSVLVSWESIRNQAAGFYACLLLLETGLLGRVLRVRPAAVLCLFRDHADSALFPDRCLGRSAAAVCGLQVLSVYADGQRVDPRRPDRTGPGRAEPRRRVVLRRLPFPNWRGS